MLENILQLTAVVVVFVLVLAGTYYVTKWIAKSGMIQSQSRNIKLKILRRVRVLHFSFGTATCFAYI